MVASLQTAKGKANDLESLLSMVNGYQQSCLLYAGIDLGLFDELSNGGRDLGQLASKLDVNVDALGRFLRALNAIGLIEYREGEFTLGAVGRILVSKGIGQGIRAWATLVGAEYLLLWRNLAQCVKSGEAGFEDLFDCTPWEHRQRDSRLNDAFNQVTSGEQKRTTAGLLRAYKFDDVSSVIDVGGGHGHLVAGILAKYPGLRGIVYDLPHVVDGSEGTMEENDLHGRFETIGGSFLESVPPGGDIYILKHVLHNWDDASCEKILRNLRSSMHDNARLLILENVIPDNQIDGTPNILLDIHMLVVHGGRERTLRQYQDLLSRAGFDRICQINTRPGVPEIVEAKVAEGGS